MIEIQHKGQKFSFSSSTVGLKLKQLLQNHGDDCIGFYDKENDVIYDLHSTVQGPVALSVLQGKCDLSNKLLRSSLALILADCVDGVLVDITLTEHGFACKFKMDGSISENDFAKIKDAMIEKIQSGANFERDTRSYEDSLESEYFVDLAEEGPNNWYKFGKAEIISKEPHLLTAAQCVPHFEIQKVAQEEFNGYKVQKVTVAAFFKAADLKEYLTHLEELKKHDHRLIGATMDLFHMIPEAPGSVFWLPKGWRMFRELEKIIRERSYADYQEVRTPFVMSSSFWHKSGHMQAYGKNMMHIKMGYDEEKEEAALKPMNCPGHIELFKQKLRSYRDLPFRLAEIGSCHRYEPSGSLHGLLRVRSFTMDDGHIFCAKEHIKSEVKKFMTPALDIYKYFGFENISIQISTRPEGFLGEVQNWDYAEKMLQEALTELQLPFKIAEGEGAFYGPKIEIHVRDSMGRSWQLGTIQLDFVLPERFDISYVDEQGQKARPCMLHRAMIGSIERFIAVLLEHTAGKLPLFLAPIQIVVCTVVDEVKDYARLVVDKLKALGLRIELDDRSHTLSHKIREHKVAKVPMMIIIGKDEAANGTVTLEYAGQKHIYEMEKLDEIMRHFSETK